MAPYTPHKPSSRQQQLVEMGLESNSFVQRHIGPSPEEVLQMLEVLGMPTLDALALATVPTVIRLTRPLQLGAERSEYAALLDL